MPTAPMDIAAAPAVGYYLDYRSFVRDWMAARKSGQKAASYAWVARRAGCSPGHVKNVVDGRRKLQGDLLHGFCRALRLDDGDGDYFRALVDFNEALAPTEAAAALTRLADLQEQRGIRSAESTQLRYMSRWHYVAIRELAFCRGFRDDPQWISEALRGQLSPDEARHALATLLDLGLLVPQADGPPRPAWSGPIVLTTHLEWPVLASRERIDVMRQAQHALTEAPTIGQDCRSLLVVVLPVSKVHDLRRITQKFVQVISALMNEQSTALAVTPENNVRLVQASINLLPLTTPFTSTRAR